MSTEARDILEAHRCRERGMVCDEGELWCDTCKAIVTADDVAHHQLAALTAAGYSVIKLPDKDINADPRNTAIWHPFGSYESVSADVFRRVHYGSMDFTGIEARSLAAALLAAAAEAEK